jgi:GntR family transcriptional regulator/MocR family aminotransferase
MGASRVFAAHGGVLAGVPVDDQGMRTDALPRRAALAYVTPSHQYPLGGTLPLERREALLAWARNCGAYVLEDDYDSDFFYDRAPLLALKSLDHHDQVVYLGTFSKTLGAGLRIGYMVLPHSLCQAAVNAKAMLNNSQSWLEQAALAAFMAEGGYEHHVPPAAPVRGSARPPAHGPGAMAARLAGAGRGQRHAPGCQGAAKCRTDS